MSNTSQSQDPRSSTQLTNTLDLLVDLAEDGLKTKITEIGSEESFMKARTLIIDCGKSQDVLACLTPFAEKEDLHIIGASGLVSDVVFLNRQGAPVHVHRDYQILSLEGNIVFPKDNGKNQSSWAKVILTGENGLRGGPLKSLIAKSTVQVILSNVGKPNLQKKDMLKDENVTAFMNHINNQNEMMMNQVYEATMKELNQP